MRVTSRVKGKIRSAGGVEYRIRAENESRKNTSLPTLLCSRRICYDKNSIGRGNNNGFKRSAMNEIHLSKIARELGLAPKQVRDTATLLEGGATVPFIARYRKEATGSLDEVAITAVRDRMGQLQELDQRREAILKSMEDRGQLTEALKEKIRAAETLVVLEDIYLPFRPKRRTRATIAKEKGLEPLAQRRKSWMSWPKRRPSSIPKRASNPPSRLWPEPGI
jgi:hypothetical protein